MPVKNDFKRRNVCFYSSLTYVDEFFFITKTVMLRSRNTTVFNDDQTTTEPTLRQTEEVHYLYDIILYLALKNYYKHSYLASNIISCHVISATIYQVYIFKLIL